MRRAGSEDLLEAIVLRRQLDCAATPKALFAVLADCERLNRALGQVPLLREPLSGNGASRFLLRTSSGKRSIAFAEPPAQLISGKLLSIKRLLHKGALASIETKYLLAPLLSGTRLTIELSLVPRVSMLTPLLRLHGSVTLWSLTSLIQRVLAASSRGEDALHRGALLDEEALQRARAEVMQLLPGEQHPLLTKLIEHVQSLDDVELRSLRPYAMADAWGNSREAVLSVCLIAAAKGLLAISWDVLCPSCRLPVTRLPMLHELTEETYCQLCDLRIPCDLENAVEVTFRPSPEVCPHEQPLYSSQSPVQQPHILYQQLLAASSEAQLTVPGEPGEFRLFVRGGLTAKLRVTTLGPVSAKITVGEVIAPEKLEIGLNGTLTIVHQSRQARHLKLERLEWERDTLSGHAVTLQPLFRQLHSQQVLKKGLLRAVPYVGLWMSELVGGTELCTQLGDIGAFSLVQEHFELLRQAVEREGGTLIKTDRDNALAAFPSSEAAVRSAVSGQQALAIFRAANPQAASLSLRVGLYAGPCHLVTQSGRLDYYGQTLLLCSRMLREAHAGDILLAADLGDKLQKTPGLRVGPRFTLSVKGLPQPVPVVRLTLDQPGVTQVEPSSLFRL